MSQSVFIFHGSYGNPNENWMPWLKSELEKLGLEVIVPHFPTPVHQSLASWLQVMELYKQLMNHQTIFVGHSLGATFALHLLELYSAQAAYLVAPFIDLLANPEFDQVNHSFVEHQFNWIDIQKHCQAFTVLHSDNDPYVPLPLAQKVADGLKGKLTVVPNAGHFNSAAGYNTFPLLLERIRAEIK